MLLGLNKDLLQYLVELLPPHTQLCVRFVCKQLWLQLLPVINKTNKNTPVKQIDVVKSTVIAGELNILQWLKETLRYPLDKRIVSNTIMDNAAAYGHIHILEWSIARGHRMDKYTCSNAASNGQLKALQWLKKNGCPWSSEACSFAAMGGHLDTLIWLRENGCEWDESTCNNAAVNGHLETLIWARQNGCPWEEKTSANAAFGNHLHVLLWLKENGCPCADQSNRPVACI